MRPFRPTAGVLVAALILASVFLAVGCAQPAQTPRETPLPGTEDRRLVGNASQVERTDGEPESKTLSASIPARDTRGEPVPGLPRHPGSVRVGYSEKAADGLMLVRTAYLTEENPDAVRGFYRDVFREGGWQVANVEYMTGGVWHFLVLHGGREAEVEVLPRGGGSEVKIELRGPAGGAQESGASAGGSKR